MIELSWILNGYKQWQKNSVNVNPASSVCMDIHHWAIKKYLSWWNILPRYCIWIKTQKTRFTDISPQNCLWTKALFDSHVDYYNERSVKQIFIMSQTVSPPFVSFWSEKSTCIKGNAK